jgi:hypothetical protein
VKRIREMVMRAATAPTAEKTCTFDSKGVIILVFYA